MSKKLIKIWRDCWAMFYGFIFHFRENLGFSYTIGGALKIYSKKFCLVSSQKKKKKKIQIK